MGLPAGMDYSSLNVVTGARAPYTLPWPFPQGVRRRTDDAKNQIPQWKREQQADKAYGEPDPSKGEHIGG
jgi:hypothetical protein